MNTGVSHFSYLLLLPVISICTTTKVLKNKKKTKKIATLVRIENRKLVRIELISIDIESWDLEFGNNDVIN